MGAVPSRESIERYRKTLESSECLESDMLRLLRSFPLQRNTLKEVHAKHSSRNKKKQLVLIPLTKSFVSSLGIAECLNRKRAPCKEENIKLIHLQSDVSVTSTQNHAEKVATEEELHASHYTHLHSAHHLQETEEQLQQELQLCESHKETLCYQYSCHQRVNNDKDEISLETHNTDTICASQFPLVRQLFTVYNEPAVQFYNVAAPMPESTYSFDQLPQKPQYSTLQEFFNATVEQYDKRLYATDEELCAA